MSLASEKEIVGNLTFNALPFNGVGSSNYIEMEKDAGVTVATFNTEESTYDTLMGY